MEIIKSSAILRRAAGIIHSDLKKSMSDRCGTCDALQRAYENLYKVNRLEYRYLAKTKGRENAIKIKTSIKHVSKMFASFYKNQRVGARRGSLFWFGLELNSKQLLYPIYKFDLKTQNHRIIALLMTAAMCESEGD